MLSILAEITFYRPKHNYLIDDGVSATNPLRPAFNFGKELLFSGIIEDNNINEKYLYDNNYTLNIKFPTVDDEAYEVIQPLIVKGMYLQIQTASKIIGRAKLLDYSYAE